LDPETDLQRLSRLSKAVAADYVDEAAAEWKTSPFSWIRKLPSSRQKGKVGESLVRAWAESEGVEVRPPNDPGNDCILDGVLVEVKFSLRWAGGEFVFQQIGIRATKWLSCSASSHKRPTSGAFRRRSYGSALQLNMEGAPARTRSGSASLRAARQRGSNHGAAPSLKRGEH